MVRLTEPQIQALCRFNRGFAVIHIELQAGYGTDADGRIYVDALLKHDIRKRFVLDQKGALVKNGQVQAQ